MEDLYLAERVLERVRLGEEGTVPLDEIIPTTTDTTNPGSV